MDANHAVNHRCHRLGIEDEVKGDLGSMEYQHDWKLHYQTKKTAKAIEDSDLTYTLLRLAWLYDKDGNTNYEITQSGEPFGGTEVTRQAVAQLIIDILNDDSRKFARKSIGVNEPNTNFDKPSFY